MFLQKFLHDVQTKPIDNKTWIVNIDALDAVLNATFGNFKVTNASFDDGGTLFTLQESRPQIWAILEDISFKFDFEYNITTDPELLQDVGRGKIIIDSLTADLQASQNLQFDSDGKMVTALNFDRITLSCANFDAQFRGGDIALVANSLTGIVTAFIKEYIMRQFDDSARNALTETINGLIAKSPTSKTIKDFTLDYEVVPGGLKVSQEFVSVAFDGTFYRTDENTPSMKKEYNVLPFYVSGGHDFQVFISEYSLNSVLNSFVNSKKLLYNTTITSDQVEGVIDDFFDPFGEQEEVLLIFQATPTTKFKPKVTIDPYQTSFAFQADIHIMNPFDKTVDAMVLTCQFTASMIFEIDNNFTLSGRAEDVQIEFVNIDAYFKTAINAHKLNGRLGVLQPIILAYINSVMNKGIQIPIPQNIMDYIKQPRIRTFENYLFIDAQPDFSKFGTDDSAQSRPIVQKKIKKILKKSENEKIEKFEFL